MWFAWTYIAAGAAFVILSASLSTVCPGHGWDLGWFVLSAWLIRSCKSVSPTALICTRILNLEHPDLASDADLKSAPDLTITPL